MLDSVNENPYAKLVFFPGIRVSLSGVLMDLKILNCPARSRRSLWIVSGHFSSAVHRDKMGFCLGFHSKKLAKHSKHSNTICFYRFYICFICFFICFIFVFIGLYKFLSVLYKFYIVLYMFYIYIYICFYMCFTSFYDFYIRFYMFLYFFSDSGDSHDSSRCLEILRMFPEEF